MVTAQRRSFNLTVPPAPQWRLPLLCLHLSPTHRPRRSDGVHLRAGFGQRRHSGGLGENRCGRGGGGGGVGSSVPHGGDELALGVEQQLRGDGLDLEALQGERWRWGRSGQGGRVQQQRERSDDLQTRVQGSVSKTLSRQSGDFMNLEVSHLVHVFPMKHPTQTDILNVC